MENKLKENGRRQQKKSIKWKTTSKKKWKTTSKQMEDNLKINGRQP
jgi:hypothetical protein